MQVSVPGIYQNPAPYREQTFTYSTALALTGRSAACAPLMPTRTADEPRIRLLTNFIVNLQVALQGGFRIRWVLTPLRLVPLSLETRVAASRLRTLPLNARDSANHLNTGRPRDAPLRRIITITHDLPTRN